MECIGFFMLEFNSFKIQNLQSWILLIFMVFIENSFYCNPLNENNYDLPKPDADCDQDIDEDYFN